MAIAGGAILGGFTARSSERDQWNEQLFRTGARCAGFAGKFGLELLQRIAG